MTSQKKGLPSIPEFSTPETVDTAIAKTTLRLMDEKVFIRHIQLANLDSQDQASTSLLFWLGREYNLKFFTHSAIIRCILSQAEGNRRRSEQMVDVTRQPQIMSPEMGIFGKIRNRLT